MSRTLVRRGFEGEAFVHEGAFSDPPDFLFRRVFLFFDAWSGYTADLFIPIMPPSPDCFRLALRRVLRGMALALLAATSASAITWETTERELKLDAGTLEVVVEFPFQNNTQAPVTFTGVKSGCECSVPDLPDQPIPAGGKGVLKIRYRPGTTPGERAVSLDVHTDEPGSPLTGLRIKATLYPVLTISPVLLRWPRHDPAEPRESIIRGTGRVTFTALTLLTPPATVAATLTPGKEPDTWILSITPGSTRDALTARVQFQAEADGRTFVHAVYAVVR